jgi:hypothetical protein
MQTAPSTLPQPPDRADLEHLGEQIAELAAQITAAGGLGRHHEQLGS